MLRTFPEKFEKKWKDQYGGQGLPIKFCFIFAQFCLLFSISFLNTNKKNSLSKNKIKKIEIKTRIKKHFELKSN